MVACLELAKEYSREEATLKVLIGAYPNEPTFLWREARMLRKEKKPEQALEWVDKAEALAYGYNWMSLQMLKANLLLDLKRNEEAKKVVNETLAQVHLEASENDRNQLMVERLRSLQAQAQVPVEN